MTQESEILKSYELLVDEICSHLEEENRSLPSLRAGGYKTLVKKKETLLLRHESLVKRLMEGKLFTRENLSDQLRQKLIHLDVLLASNDRIIRAVTSARQNLIETVKGEMTKKQRPHAKVYNQGGRCQSPPRRRLNVSLSMNYCY